MLCKCYPFTFIVLLFLSARCLAQVDLPTGRATFGLPLYSYTDGSRLSLDLSLNYTGGGGIPVNQIPSSVGLGWDLLGGGSITRRTVGVPDDQIGGIYDDYRFGDGFMVYYAPLFQPIDPKAGFLPLVDPASESVYQPNAKVLRDLQQDVFDFQFGGRSGSFMISQTGIPTPVDNSKLRIQKRDYKALNDDSTITTIGAFIITDEMGIRYTFSETDKCNLIINKKGRIAYPTGVGTKVNIPNYSVSNYYVHNTWYLSEIYDPFSGHKITFNYKDYKLNYTVGYEAVRTVTAADGTTKEAMQSLPVIFAGTRKRLSSIQFPDNTTSVSFLYGDSDMVDLPGQKPLNQILIKQDTVTTSGYQFAYEYFFKDSTRAFSYAFSPLELKYARLSLKSVQKTGRYNIADAPYVFSYYNKVILSGGVKMVVPPRAICNRDHWGYYNNNPFFEQNYATGDSASTSAAVLTMEQHRQVDGSGSAMMGILKEIQYPSGGKLLYEYENNDALSAGVAKLSGGVRVKRTSWFDMVDTSKKIVKDYRYVNADGTSSGWGYEKPILTENSYSKFVIPPSSSGFKVGDFAYAYTVNPETIRMVGNALGYGSLAVAGEAIVTQLFWGIIVAIIVDIFTPPPTTKTIVAFNTQDYSTHPSKYNLLPHMYKRVEVYEGSTDSSIGKVVSEFTSPDDFPILVPTQSQPYSNQTRCLPWVYGLVKRQQEIARNGNVRTETVYSYLPLTTKAGEGNIFWRPKTMLLCPEPMFTDYQSLIELYSQIYSPIFGRTDLNSVTRKTYDSTGNFTQLTTLYNYDSLNLLPSRVSMINSQGDTIQTRSYYTADYNPLSFPVIRAMQDANAISVPVASEVWQLNNAGQKLLNASNIEYKFQSKGDIKPEQVQGFQNDIPLSASQAGSFTGTTLNRMPGYVKKQKTMSYDSEGNLVHIANPNDADAGFQWGYGDKYGSSRKYITAEVRNAHALHSEKTGAAGAVVNKSLYVWGTSPQSLNFTLTQPSTVFLTITDSLSGNAMGNYTLSCNSPSFSASNTLCKVTVTGRLDDQYNLNMGIYRQYDVYTNLPAGNYTLTASNASFAVSLSLGCSYFPDPSQDMASEFYYNGFEDSNYADSIRPYAGNGCYSGDFIVPFNAPTGRSYRVDYRYFSAGKWSYNSKPYVNGMTLSDGVAIDEVRVSPTDADITTYTYEPGVGVSSQTDRNGNTAFNEYDYLCRLTIVRDKDRNILKRICYNYAGQPELCGGQTYTNDAFSQVFTNNTCSNGFTPGTSSYTVPAGKYTADDKNTANFLAQEDIRLNGQKVINQITTCSCGGDEPGSEPDHKVINGNCVAGVKTYFNRHTPGQVNMCDYGYYYKFPDGTTSVWIVTQQRPCQW